MMTVKLLSENNVWYACIWCTARAMFASRVNKGEDAPSDKDQLTTKHEAAITDLKVWRGEWFYSFLQLMIPCHIHLCSSLQILLNKTLAHLAHLVLTVAWLFGSSKTLNYPSILKIWVCKTNSFFSISRKLQLLRTISRSINQHTTVWRGSVLFTCPWFS